MGSWGFRKVLRLGRIARITMGKKSVGASVGVGPFRIGVNSRGTMRKRVTIPGTGVYYEQRDRIGVPVKPTARSTGRVPFVAFACIATVLVAVLLFALFR